MNRKDLLDMYSFPDDYRPPDGLLNGNTEYPNLNSEEYRRKIHLQPVLNPEFYERILLSGQGELLLATNDYRRRLWCGCLFGFGLQEDISDLSKATFKHHSTSPISAIQFLKDDMVIFGTATGGVEVWELKKEEADQKTSVYKVDSKYEHLDVVSGMELLKQSPNKIVTSDWNGCLKVWEMDNMDLINLNTYHQAHGDAVTAVSAHPSEDLFISVSRDKSALLWDHRQIRPALGLLDEHKFQLTAVTWNSNVDNQHEIIIGDVDGTIMKLDQRNPGIVQTEQKVLNRSIRKIAVDDKCVAACGNTNTVKVLNEKWEPLFEQTTSDFVRDVLFRDSSLWMLSMDGKLTKHKINK